MSWGIKQRQPTKDFTWTTRGLFFSGTVRPATTNDLSPRTWYLSIAKWSLFHRSALVLKKSRLWISSKEKILKVKSLKIRNSPKNWSEVKQNHFVGTCSRAPLAYSVPVSITIDISLLDRIGRSEYIYYQLLPLWGQQVFQP